MTPIWCIVPVMADRDMTMAAIADLLAQSVPVRILIILQRVDEEFRREFDLLAEQESRVLIWNHNPTLPSLAATWNRALQFVWACGGTEALVVNADVRLHPRTIETLRVGMAAYNALFVSAVGVRAEQFDPNAPVPLDLSAHGGPDFSCFLISKACHDRFQFDEGCVPAYLEDLTMHREMLLAGEGHRIFSINLPFHHIGGGSASLKAMTPEQRRVHEIRIERGSRAHYLRSWGGPANQERYTIKGDPSTAQDGVTTPDLQRLVQGLADVST